MGTNANVVAADDLVEALLAFFPKDQADFATGTETIHTAFYELKEMYPEAFQDFVFDMDRPFPYCEDIEFALTCLVGTSLLSTQNPYLERFLVTDKLKQHFENVTRSRVELPQVQLLEFSKILQSKLRR